MLRSLTLILGWFTVAATAAAGSPRAPLININGETIGTATLRQLETGTVVELSASGLPPARWVFTFMKRAAAIPETSSSLLEAITPPKTTRMDSRVRTGHMQETCPICRSANTASWIWTFSTLECRSIVAALGFSTTTALP